MIPDTQEYTEALAAFLSGKILKLKIKEGHKPWNVWAWWLEKKQALELWQADGHYGTYGNVSMEEAIDFYNAESQNKWVHKHLKAGYLDNRKWYHAKPYYDEIHADTLPDVT